jgi:hypothetical protein
LINGPRPIGHTYGTNAFRDDQASILDEVVDNGDVVLIEKRGTKRSGPRPMAVVISPDLWNLLGLLQRDLDGASAYPDGAGGFLSHDQLAAHLRTESEQLGGETYQLTAGEMRLMRAMLTELASVHPDDALGPLAREWADRLGTRTAPSM